jgi:hypothetical protein
MSHAAEPSAYNRTGIENVIRIWKKIIKTTNCLIQRRCSQSVGRIRKVLEDTG